MSDYNCLLLTIDNDIARITLNRPNAANALNLEMARELVDVANRLDNTAGLRAVLITGAGKFFCAGGDVASFAEAGDDVGLLVRDITMNLHAAVSRLSRMKAPVITAVNGAAAGAGFSLAIAGDLVLASESASFTMAYTGIGASPDGSSSFYLPRLVGLRRAQELMFTNRRLKGAEAAEWGLITRAVADDQLMDEAEAMLQQIANGPIAAHASIKDLLRGAYSESLETQMELETRGIAGALSTPEGREGVLAFTEKRKPDFKGQ